MSLYQSLAVRAAQVGKKIVFGTVTPTTASEEVVTGLSSVDHVFATLAGDPVATCMWVNGEASGTAGNATIVSKKPTTTTNVTPIDATTFVAVDWIAIGE